MIAATLSDAHFYGIFILAWLTLTFAATAGLCALCPGRIGRWGK